MDKKNAEKLIWFVNELEVQEAVEFYVAYRVQLLREHLDTCKDLNKILEIQGAIQELKRFGTLRDEVLLHKKDK